MLLRRRQLVQWALVPRLGLRTVDLLSSSVLRGRLSPGALISSPEPLRRTQVPHRTWAEAPLQGARPERKPDIRGRLVDLDPKSPRLKA